MPQKAYLGVPLNGGLKWTLQKTLLGLSPHRASKRGSQGGLRNGLNTCHDKVLVPPERADWMLIPLGPVYGLKALITPTINYIPTMRSLATGRRDCSMHPYVPASTQIRCLGL